ncbi:hypothetical protein NPA31_014370 [Aurantimonas sp. MSK8Z-1]|uniref:hypothetical protein n=1 Tax=Mangrovibrevibacter kandeliae TaxID=2968473 RepID=UPI0021182145|nr:hypothetical protein [Aurantimonas sp. MSK8Z-1]MCW4116148.1 hypothetical protein [Aurantimonas sp. MSK8Z-1]
MFGMVGALWRRLGSLGGRLTEQLVISGLVALALHLVGNGAGLYAWLGGVGQAPQAEAAATLVATPKAPRLVAPSAAAPVDTDSATPAPTASARRAADSLPTPRGAALGTAEATAAAEGVILFTDCGTACESHDPLLARSVAPSDRPGMPATPVTLVAPFEADGPDVDDSAATAAQLRRQASAEEDEGLASAALDTVVGGFHRVLRHVNPL